MTDPLRVPSMAASASRPRRPTYDVLVVGAGFAGAVIAERAASAGLRVLVIDRRDHVGGNAFDALDEHGVLIHRYGLHAFHTNDARVSGYLSRFTDWRAYEHQARALVDGQLVPLPINRDTINLLHNRELRGGPDVKMYLNGIVERHDQVRNSEEKVVSQVGRDLYERLFRGYTRKQWALDPSELDATVCGRIPVRFDVTDRYFDDRFQAMPLDGYTAMFERMLDHRLIERQLGVDFDLLGDRVAYRTLVWTGPIDQYFGHRFGELPYRSLNFEFRSFATPDGGLVQPVGQLNYPSETVPYTRSAEYRILTGQGGATSTISYEYPTAEGDPYYPIPRPENRARYARYAEVAKQARDVVFVGRLARYQYLNMDQVVAQALTVADQHFEPTGFNGRRERVDDRASTPAIPVVVA